MSIETANDELRALLRLTAVLAALTRVRPVDPDRLERALAEVNAACSALMGHIDSLPSAMRRRRWTDAVEASATMSPAVQHLIDVARSTQPSC